MQQSSSNVEDSLRFFLDPGANSHIEAVDSLTMIVKDAPCNLNCDYCYLNNCKSVTKPIFLEDKVLPLVQPYTDTDGRVLVWAGEPLFNKEIFVRICKFINRYLPRRFITIFTNGTLLDDWWADFFKEHKVKVMLSHDGPGQKYRGLDYLKSDTHKKVIKRIHEDGNLLGVSTVIHKYNCSFFDIKSYFDEVEKNFGFAFSERTQSLVGADLQNNLPLDFDFMDKGLIGYIQDCVSFLLKELLNGDKNGYVQRWYTWSSTKSYMPILQILLGVLPPIPKRCSTEDVGQVSISSTGQHMCIYRSYTGAVLPPSCTSDKPVDLLTKCASCEIYRGCPVKGCQKLSIDENLCKKVIARYKTIEFALTELLSTFNFGSNKFKE